MKINLIIPNYNGSDLIIKNLPSVINSLESYKDSKITIVDDGSNISDFGKVKKYISSLDKKNAIELIRKEKNSGFSGAVNKGALISDSDFLVLLNSDVSPEKNFLSAALKDFENNPSLFGVGCMDKSVEEDAVVLRGRGLASWEKGFLNHRRGNINSSDTFWIHGGSCVIRTEIFKKLGGFHEVYNPFYWEDIDLSYRARKAGYSILFENKSVVVHRHKEGAIKKHYSKANITKIALRNQFIFIWKNISDISLLLSHALWLPYHIIKSLLKGESVFVVGFLLAVMKLPDIIRLRKKQMLQYNKIDRELI